MQRSINEDIHLGKTVNPNDHMGKIKSINMFSDFNEITSKVDKQQTLLKTGFFDKNLLDHLPRIQQTLCQGMIYDVNAR